ncbi:hypothetical protein KI387_011842, partial [Taxus chinensis]
MARKGFIAHVEDVDMKHLVLSHLGKHGRELLSYSDESTLEESIRTTGMHLIPPNDLALVLGVSVPKIVVDKQDSVVEKEATSRFHFPLNTGVNQIAHSSMVVQTSSLGVRSE